ncbi:MAG: hypothetical protein ACI38B_07155 [Bifidobacterium sp.]|uniref:hypothetical protein n=1 Tax=Bifidobacterium sp. TaxID=41200 RepID=UPI003F00CD2D
MTDTPRIRRARDWPFPIPQITAEAIDELVDAIERGDRWTGSLYDELDGATREMSDPDQETIIRNYYLLEEWAHTDTEAVPEERDGNGS